jgi:proteasome lid subunit RPN8/RPN11
LRLSSAVFEGLLRHARARDPEECVGLVFGHEGTATRYVPLTNRAAAPRARFFADPTELLRALVDAEVRGEALLALYHSHPDGPSVPSNMDLNNAHYHALTLIVTLRPERVRGFRLLPAGFEAVALELI